ncbi:MAG: substrate-binding domain-containing protein [Lachnospiraceae bacterium]|nr:substrate-binding domain-containing protein [Lachnospiraceae bacterium]
MRKFRSLLLVGLLVVSCLFVLTACGKDEGDGKIKVGVVNNPPSESGYREANVKDMEKVFSEANGYELKTFYSDKNDAQLQAAKGFITDGVDYLLISAAETTGWDDVLKEAKEAGVKVYLFDRKINVDESLYEAAVVSDMAKEGDTAVNWLLSLNLDEYKVIHIQGAMGSDAQIGRTGALDAQFASGKMKKIVQQTAGWDEAEAKKIVESVINSGEDFNVIYAENDGMARGAVAALDEAGITHGVDGKVVIIGFDCNKWALRELLAKKWNYDGQCSPFQAQIISDLIKSGKAPANKMIINEEKGFDAKTITQGDIDTYGLGE